MAETRETAIIVWTEKENDYFHIFAAIGYWDNADKPKYSSRYGEPRKDKLVFDGLRATSQGSNREYDGSTDKRRLYGFGLEYRDVYSLNVADAKAFARTLQTLHGRMEKLQDAQGYPKTFGQYLGQLAQAVKAKRFYLRDADERHIYRSGSSVRDLVSHVDHLERQWHEEGRPKAQEAAAS